MSRSRGGGSIVYGGPFLPVDIFSFLIPSAVIIGVVYVVIALTRRRALAAASPGAASGENGTGLDNPVLRILYTLAVASARKPPDPDGAATT